MPYMIPIPEQFASDCCRKLVRIKSESSIAEWRPAWDDDRSGRSLASAVRHRRGRGQSDAGNEDDGPDDLHNQRWRQKRF